MLEIEWYPKKPNVENDKNNKAQPLLTAPFVLLKYRSLLGLKCDFPHFCFQFHHCILLPWILIFPNKVGEIIDCQKINFKVILLPPQESQIPL